LSDFSALYGSVVLRCGVRIRYSVPLVQQSGFCALARFACFIIPIVAAPAARLSVVLRLVFGYAVRCLGRRMLRGADCRLSPVTAFVFQQIKLYQPSNARVSAAAAW
jgi:hypothetical protein